MWKVNEIRSSGLLRQFLAEGMTLYKMHCTTMDEDGDDKMVTSSSEAALMKSQNEAVKVCYISWNYTIKVFRVFKEVWWIFGCTFSAPLAISVCGL